LGVGGGCQAEGAGGNDEGRGREPVGKGGGHGVPLGWSHPGVGLRSPARSAQPPQFPHFSQTRFSRSREEWFGRQRRVVTSRGAAFETRPFGRGSRVQPTD
jgi:hypothetical protein